MKIRERITLVFGRRGSGKTVLAQHILSHYQRHWAWTPFGDWDDDTFNVIVPTARRPETGSIEEHNALIEKLVFQNRKDLRPAVWAVDELQRVAPVNEKVGQAYTEIIDGGRHIKTGERREGIGFLGISQRPAKVDKTTRELADNVFVTDFGGPADRDAIKEMVGDEGEKFAEMVDESDEYESVAYIHQAPEGKRVRHYRSVPYYS